GPRLHPDHGRRHVPARASALITAPDTYRALVVADAERLVEFSWRQRPVRGRYRAQHLGVEVDLIKGDAVVDTKIQLPGNRAHLRRWSRVRSLAPQVTCRHCSSA